MSIATLASVTLLGLMGVQQPPPVSIPQDPPVTAVEDVLVVGRSLEAAIDSFVDGMVAAPVGRGPARWNQTVCVGVANLRKDVAQVMVDRISEVALELDIGVGEPGCSPNVLVIATDDASALAEALVSTRPRAFRPGWSGAARSSEALERFQLSDAPVRWWHVSLPVDADTGAAAVRIGSEPAPAFRVQPSRLRTQVRNNLLRAFVIIDFPPRDGITFQQLSDYVAMVAFAQVDADADLSGYDTVLNLFGPSAPQGLTSWDRAYLGALYGAELNQTSVGAQEGAVARGMLKDRTDADLE